MYQFINFNALSEMLDINLRCPEHLFSMTSYSSFRSCGTTHCLVGNYWATGLCRHSELICYFSLADIRRKLGISKAEYEFLFNCHGLTSKNAYDLNYQEALTRLAKFIIYKRRKKELWADYEKARRTEGTNMFCEIGEKEVLALVPSL